MPTSLERIASLIPPPSSLPFGKVDWEQAEKAFGLSFPSDFKQFVAHYGHWGWKGFVWPICPNTESATTLEESRRKALDLVEAMYKGRLYKDEEPITLPRYPELGGLFPCALTVDSDILCWLTTGSPDTWQTVLYQVGNLFYLDCSFTEAWCNWLEGKTVLGYTWGKIEFTDVFA